ncbi:MAG TPA: thymidylate kinase [Terracidiphilus sp.]
MPSPASVVKTNIVSFSGIDGSGKSTQIDALRDRLKQEGVEVKVIRFWDDVARLTSLRESAGHKLFKGDKGVGSPEAPLNRRDKNVQSWPMSGVRLFIYFVDAISTRIAVNKARRSGAGLVIFDRFIHDELANLNLANPANRAYARMIMALVPRLPIHYLLDADPEKARARKPEYPLEFLHFNRNAYLALNRLIGGMTVIEPMPIADVTRTIAGHAFSRLSFRTQPRNGNNSTLNVTA